jgi:hypothetical protein
MKPSVPRFARLRVALAATFALAGVLVACQATLPTDAEIESMDVATATRRAQELAKATHAETTIVYTIDGDTATTAEAVALPASTIGSVKIVNGRPRKPTRIDVITRRLSSKEPVMIKRGAFSGLILIDGVRATQSQLAALDRNAIESVEVLKGFAAQQLYHEPEAAQGVIVVMTKRGGAR